MNSKSLALLAGGALILLAVMGKKESGPEVKPIHPPVDEENTKSSEQVSSICKANKTIVDIS